MPKGQYIQLTKSDEAKIRNEYLTKSIKALAAEIGSSYGVIMRRLKKWNLVIPKEIIEARKNSCLYNKGAVPYNKGKKQIEYMSPEQIENAKKTQFKKGSLPHNTKYDGYESITKDGYVKVRVSVHEYRHKHSIEWEKVNGPLPAGHCLLCIDGNKQNTAADNWRLISRTESMYRNSKMEYPEEVIPSLLLMKKIDHKLNRIKDDKEHISRPK